MPIREVPKDYGPYRAGYARFRQNGDLVRVLNALERRWGIRISKLVDDLCWFQLPKVWKDETVLPKEAYHEPITPFRNAAIGTGRSVAALVEYLLMEWARENVSRIDFSGRAVLFQDEAAIRDREERRDPITTPPVPLMRGSELFDDTGST
jgi:hypothetical protein